MQTSIHPIYYPEAKIRCSCGHIIVAGSTRESLKTELCSKCHPFYTGTQKLVDTAGRVDKFEAKRKRAIAIKEDEKNRAAKKASPKVYEEKVVPTEVLERAMATEPKEKWGAPLGDSPAEAVKKEDEKKAPKKSKAVKKGVTMKTAVKKPSASKKTPTAKKAPKK